MKIYASSAEFGVNENFNFAMFGIPRPKRDANGTFVLSPEDVAPDVRATMLSYADIDRLNTWQDYKEEIKEVYNSHAYITKDAFNNPWVIIPFTGGCNMYSLGNPRPIGA